MLPEFRLYHKAAVTKTVLYWHKKKTYRSMEQNGAPQNKPMHLWSINLQQKEGRLDYGQKTVFSINGAGKTGEHVKG